MRRVLRRLLPAWVVLALTAGLLALSPMSPAAADAPWCSTACNGKLPTASVTLLNGAVVKCINSAVTVGGPYNPQASDGGYDTYVVVRHMYSSSCQTTWVRVTVNGGTHRTSCYAYERRYAAPVYQTPNTSCPASGTKDTPMVNDHDDAHGSVAYGYLYEVSWGFPVFVRTASY